jgi:hypothetical protein
MAAIGRILQIIGWLWFIAGFVGPVFDFESVNPFPGLVLIFIARIFRARARSEMPPGPGDVGAEPQPAQVETRRSQPRQQTPLPPKRVETPPVEKPNPEPRLERPVDERNELLERIAMAGRETAEEPANPRLEKKGATLEEGDDEPSDVVKPQMSSAEMIARARKRWDSNRG